MLKLSIVESDARLPPQLDATAPGVEVWRDQDGTACAYGQTLGSECWLHLPNVATFRFDETGSEVHAFPAESARPEWIVDAYYRTVIPMALQVRGVEVLHASAVRTPLGVLALCAPKETGKSTLAFALARRGHSLWADDAVAFQHDAGVISALSLPFDLRLRPPSAVFFGEDTLPPPSRTACEPLGLQPASFAAICVLERGTALPAGRAVDLARLYSADAFSSVLAHAYCFSLHDAYRRQRMMENYLRLAKNVPVFRAQIRTGLGNLAEILDALEQAAA